ncbi:MAG: glycosyltransferase family 4 protein [Planctomycetota bacterium]|jgi:glycosyltransferase involved in cell wall biosynthesis
MKVLHVNTEMGWRGGEQQVLYLMQGLAARGVEQALVCQPGSAIAERARAEGIEVKELRMRGEVDLFASWRIGRLASQEGFDLLHLHTSHAHMLGTMAKRFAKRPKPKTVVARRVDFSIYRHSFLGLNGLKYTMGVDRILCVSERIREVLLEDGLSPDRIRVAHSGVDLARIDGAEDQTEALREELSIPDGAAVIGNVGALVDHKGQRYLLEAAPAVFAAHPHARIVIAGSGALAEDLEALARSLGVRDRVSFLGFRSDVPSLLRVFDVFAFPSLLEGLGTSVLDALSARLPVVASRTGGIPEMIEDGETGLLVPPKDAVALGEALVRLLGDPALAKRLGEAGRARVEREFTIESTLDKTLLEYQALLAKS